MAFYMQIAPPVRVRPPQRRRGGGSFAYIIDEGGEAFLSSSRRRAVTRDTHFCPMERTLKDACNIGLLGVAHV